MRIFNHKTLAIAIASVGTIGTANAAGLDRSGQDVTAFLQDGTYAEAVYTYISTDVSGYDNAVAGGAHSTDYTKGNATGNISEKYDFFRYGVKTDINDRFSVGVLYDEPFGAAVKHTDGTASNFVANDDAIATISRGDVPNLAIAKVGLSQAETGIAQLKAGITQLETGIELAKRANLDTSIQEAQLDGLNERLSSAQNKADGLRDIIKKTENGEGTNVEIRTQNLTMLLGAKFGKNNNFQVYGGPALQRLTGEVALRGAAYQSATGYNAKIATDQAVGWVAGVSYSKPEIALKAALTYRSEIEHSSTISETLPALGLLGQEMSSSRDFKVTLPHSYNLDFQTGVNPTTLLTAKVRYVPWGDFDIRPPTYGDATARVNHGTPLAIVSYDKDQWSAELGLGKKLSDKLSIAGNIGYDSGAGNPVSSLGPIKGYYSAGLGVKYNVTPEWSVSLGGKYLKFGDATAQLPNKDTVGKFEDNDGFIAGLKIAYHAK